MKIRCLIVDDEYLLADLLEKYISMLPQLELVHKCNNAICALEVLQKESVDLVFLDIQMPELTGLEFIRTLQNPPEIILTTAYSQYAIEAFELSVLDYLLKPIKFERFVSAVNKFPEKSTQINETESSQKDEVTRDFVMIKANNRLQKIELDAIIYIEGLKEYVKFHTTKGNFVALYSLIKLEKLLPSEKFVRIQRSYIVSINSIESVIGNMLEIAGEKLPIGKKYKDTLFMRLGEIL